MNLKIYIVFRENDSSVLNYNGERFFLEKNTESNIYLSTQDDYHGVLHDHEKIYFFVQIDKVLGKFTLKNIENNHFFCSQPLKSEDIKKEFISNRSKADAWERFDLKEVVLNHSIFLPNFLDFLKNYKKDEVNLYWWRGNGFKNFGDELNPHIISYLTGKSIKRVEKSQTDLIGIGSILDWFPERSTSYHVWGAGTLCPTSLLPVNNYKISLLRGPLTKSLISNDTNVDYGDPGILASKIWQANPHKKFDWGVIVHFSQENKQWVKDLVSNTSNCLLISVKNENMGDLMLQISSCNKIASTSLHGLIVADSYCIPNIWLWDNNLHRGGQWKFFDYFAGVNRTYVDNINPQKIKSLNNVDISKNDYRYFDNIYNIQERIVKSFPL